MRFGRFLVGLWCAVLVAGVSAAKAKIEINYDKEFDFKPMRSFAWHPQGAGDVKVLEANETNSAADLKARLEPMVTRAVEQTFASRGITKATASPDLYVTY